MISLDYYNFLLDTKAFKGFIILKKYFNLPQ